MSATVLIDARLVHVLRDQFGRHCEVEARLDDGRARVRLAAPARAQIEVLGPEPVRAGLARLGAELVRCYAAEPLTAVVPRRWAVCGGIVRPGRPVGSYGRAHRVTPVQVVVPRAVARKAVGVIPVRCWKNALNAVE